MCCRVFLVSTISGQLTFGTTSDNIRNTNYLDPKLKQQPTNTQQQSMNPHTLKFTPFWPFIQQNTDKWPHICLNHPDALSNNVFYDETTTSSEFQEIHVRNEPKLADTLKISPTNTLKNQSSLFKNLLMYCDRTKCNYNLRNQPRQRREQRAKNRHKFSHNTTHSESPPGLCTPKWMDLILKLQQRNCCESWSTGGAQRELYFIWINYFGPQEAAKSSPQQPNLT